MKGHVESATDRDKLQRKVGASVSHFSQVPALLAETDLFATMTPLVMGDGIARYGLCALEPPIDIEPARFSLAWSFRHATDPGNEWLRAIVKTQFDILSTHAQSVVIGGHQRKRRKPKGVM